jgi:hypothetical protein
MTRSRNSKTLLLGNNVDLIKLLTVTQLISQLELENALYELKIIDRARTIELENFSGQLERDSESMPYWNISVETTSLTTKKSVALALSRQMFDHTEIIDPSIKIHSTVKFEQTEKHRKLLVSDSDWHPGYFSKITITLLDLLRRKEIQESIRDAPYRYNILINSHNSK